MIEQRIRRRPHEEGESYFMSMTDMMVGLLLIFIILLVYLALNFKERTAELAGGKETRTEALEALEASLLARGVRVSIDRQNGVLRLPEDVLFESGDYNLSSEGAKDVAQVAEAMVEVLPCYTSSPLCRGERKQHLIDAVFVEGHTDTTPMLGAFDNYGLSVRRAEVTFDKLQEAQPALRAFRNKPEGQPGSAPILSLSGYGPDRPIASGEDEASKRKNRRIDLRFLMMAPGSQLPDQNILQQR